MLDKISVDYYGTPTPISQLATISLADARTLVIQPWDNSLLKIIDHAIQASDLGIMPQNDGRIIRIVFPPLTEERRRDLTKQVAKMGEEAKVSIRNIRRDAKEKAKEMKKKSEMTEDELKASEKTSRTLPTSTSRIGRCYREKEQGDYGDNNCKGFDSDINGL